MRDLRLDLALQRGQRLLAAVAALEVVLAGGPRKAMQEDLQHGELVEVGVEQTGDDRRQIHGVLLKRMRIQA
jgi:hypothetical protein